MWSVRYFFCTLLSRASLGALGSCFALSASCCPLIDKLIDYNCDRSLKIAFTGDSIAYGVGDELNENSGGYGLRLSQTFPDSIIRNVGVRGITSDQLLRAFKKNLRKLPHGKTYFRSVNTDIMLIDVGRNDYWSELKPSFTVRNIRRLVKFLRTELAKYDEAPPYIAVNTLLPTTRLFQKPFIDEVNKLLIAEQARGLTLAAHFDQVPSELISDDGLHPTSAGYDAMAFLLREFLKGDAQRECRARRADSDSDQIFDRFERSKFGTDPALPDTDADGLLDGEELFVLGTDPLVADAPTPAPT